MLKVAFQIDPIDSLNKERDSSLLLMQEGLERGCDIYHYTPNRLCYEGGKVFATGQRYQDPEQVNLDLAKFDIIFIRQDPPFDLNYITTTYLLEKLPKSVLLINNPTAIRNFPEKLFIDHPEITPDTMITQDKSKIDHFFDKHQKLILKPLYAFGGLDVIKIEDKQSLYYHFDVLFDKYKTPIILQQYLPTIAEGDKRVMMLDGEILAYFNRRPKNGNYLANLAAGGIAEKTTLSSKEQEVCDLIGAKLKQHNIIFAGIDIIGGYATEVNITSPTGIAAVNQLFNLTGKNKLQSVMWDRILSY